jgi:hypothetical protein
VHRFGERLAFCNQFRWFDVWRLDVGKYGRPNWPKTCVDDCFDDQWIVWSFVWICMGCWKFACVQIRHRTWVSCGLVEFDD